MVFTRGGRAALPLGRPEGADGLFGDGFVEANDGFVIEP